MLWHYSVTNRACCVSIRRHQSQHYSSACYGEYPVFSFRVFFWKEESSSLGNCRASKQFRHQKMELSHSEHLGLDVSLHVGHGHSVFLRCSLKKDTSNLPETRPLFEQTTQHGSSPSQLSHIHCPRGLIAMPGFLIISTLTSGTSSNRDMKSSLSFKSRRPKIQALTMIALAMLP